VATWPEKRAALREAISWALQLQEGPAVPLLDGTMSNAQLAQWEGENNANRWTKGVWCNLRLSWVTPRGRDESRQSFDEATDQVLYRYGGQRHFNVMVIVGSDNQHDADAIGQATASLRVLIRHPHVRAILGAADIGLAEVRRTIHADYTQHGVRYSQSMTEIAFNTIEEYVETPTTAMSPDYIRRVQTLPDGEGRFATGRDGDDIIRQLDVSAPE
jgi:hypothetical protein